MVRHSYEHWILAPKIPDLSRLLPLSQPAQALPATRALTLIGKRSRRDIKEGKKKKNLLRRNT